MNAEAPLSSKLSMLLERITMRELVPALVGLSVLTMLLGTYAAYTTSGPLPPPGPPPPSPEASTVMSYRYKQGFYRAQLDEDSKKLGLALVDPKTLQRANAYRLEFAGRKRLKVGQKLTTRSLRMKVLKRRVWIGERGRGLRALHLVLEISNRTRRYLAYRVKTRVSGVCRPKGAIPHNALALKPKERIGRTECPFRSAKGLTIAGVEVLELTPLGYQYVSRIDPAHLGADSRTSEGHVGGRLPACKLVPWRAIRTAFTEDKARWYDVVDFYSRHNCDEYSFFVGYRWAKNGIATPLPVKPPQVAAGEAPR